MEAPASFERAARYTLDSIEHCQQLANFIKKRLAIEEEYAKALRKLCKSVSLTPLQQHQQQQQKGSWFSRSKPAETGPDEDVGKMSLWSTFYEIVDDTAQVSKSHSALAESLQHQLLEPLGASIKEMEGSRRRLVEEGVQLGRDLVDAEVALRKMRKKFDQSNKEAIESRTALERMQAVGSRDLQKMQTKSRASEERLASSRQSYRQQEEAHRALQSKMYVQELPRIMTKLQQQEAQRSRDALSYILGLIELERRCAVMNESYANEMALKLKKINLADDEWRYTKAYIQDPAPAPALALALALASPPTHTAAHPAAPATPASHANANASAARLASPPPAAMPLVAAEIPRTISMPPAYEPQPAAPAGPATMGIYPGTGSDILAVYGTHCRQLTVEGPSHP